MQFARDIGSRTVMVGEWPWQEGRHTATLVREGYFQEIITGTGTLVLRDMSEEVKKAAYFGKGTSNAFLFETVQEEETRPYRPEDTDVRFR